MVSDPHNRAAQKCQSSAPSFGGIRIPDSSGFPMVFQHRVNWLLHWLLHVTPVFKSIF